MPVEHTRGNVLKADVEALVNTVNCVGFMGKGIALQFKQAYPDNFAAYQRACRAEQVRPGKMFVTETGTWTGPKWIINFPTKRHWRANSRIEDIKSGLDDLVLQIRERGIRSIAVPPLGCGLGGLDWHEVRPLIEAALARVPDVRAVVFAPEGAPAPAEQVIRTEKKLTLARALFIKLMERYKGLDYQLTLLEVQKLAYFLQEAGQPLKLGFQEHHYGPYADNLNKVLENLEGHYTQGYSGDRSPDVEISLLPGAVPAADAELRNEDDAKARLLRVTQLIDGFETPYGMELLASVHWLARHREQPAKAAADAYAGLQAWNERKRQVFQEAHVRIAWDRLTTEGWLPTATDRPLR